MTRRILRPALCSGASVLIRKRSIAHKTHILTFYPALPASPDPSPD
ncbi:hypothetical protein PS682_02193 [Pseudomonas fluorescens]|jgi:type IV pilus assembly protein PilC|uniref:Uncharacterized protein n=1 Tax=Pseudomonas fluorescens TaxID=294 RepID=A0A5E6MTM8_PSEFL|nr:hypothetical protein ATH90_0866 [Pseudomonas lurida]VVM14756.1 hypothetical protein PS683_03064 [Pseudomonas fluorescens]VVM78193.1 hypothetical protein PS663_02176 [Pseudomonas fluorescens]VVM78344.1 hypothetical protein PS682_02193 [Pseudomonas fluorescens]VVM95737.1 hypothetical protein PS683_03064 [Pseudomonas fluorescens]